LTLFDRTDYRQPAHRRSRLHGIDLDSEKLIVHRKQNCAENLMITSELS
jgi:hypothetical protein